MHRILPVLILTLGLPAAAQVTRPLQPDAGVYSVEVQVPAQAAGQLAVAAVGVQASDGSVLVCEPAGNDSQVVLTWQVEATAIDQTATVHSWDAGDCTGTASAAGVDGAGEVVTLAFELLPPARPVVLP